MSKVSQKKRILAYITKNGSITPKEAERFCSCMRLSARIHELKYDDLMPIIAVTEDGVNDFGEPTHYARYYLQTNNG